MKYPFWLSAFLFLLQIGSCSKEGPTGENHPIDDSIQFIQNLPEDIGESSGLLRLGDRIWTHNDSGGEPKLYALSVENQPLTHVAFIQNTENKDWEALTGDSTFIYIGDFGNNGGQRRDLAIYKIGKSDLSKDTISGFEIIEFSYPDQTRFDYEIHEHNFDCEAMVSFGDSLFLFSKNHQNNRTRLYRLPKNEGSFSAHLLADFDITGTATDAASDASKGILALLGYNFDKDSKTCSPFVWLFWDFEKTDFFGGKSKRINFGFTGQTEGICFFENGTFLISTESGQGEGGGLFLFDAKKWVE